MIRLNMIVEGQTEETFVDQIIKPYLAKEKEIMVHVRCVTTGTRKGKIYRGGVDRYHKIKKDIELWLKEDKTAYLTTMFDLYALPTDFPGVNLVNEIKEPFKKINKIENHFGKDINNRFFIPYLQLHEFEALLLTLPDKFEVFFFENNKEIQKLIEEIKGINPEMINDGEQTAPSKRIIKYLPGYEKVKATAGPMIASEIGLSEIRKQCKHFDEWIKKIEGLE